jgi:hypothetical protein
VTRHARPSRAVAGEVLDAIELELRRRDALALPPGLTPEQRAVVRVDRIRREYGPRSKYWARGRAIIDRLCLGMPAETFWRTMAAIDQDKRRRGR